MIRSSFIAALVAAIALAACAPEADHVYLAVPGVHHRGLTTTTVLIATADTHVRRGNPYSAYGSEGLLRVGTTDRRKAIVAFDPAAIAAALAGRQVVSADLELSLGAAVASFPAGQAVVAQPLNQAFVEARATYACGDDTSPTNWANNCTTANLWSLETAPFPWRATGAPVALTTGTTGTVSFDVTTDIVDVQAGTYPHHGWLVLRTLDAVGGEANFRSREDSSGPRLVIVTEPATPSAACGDGIVNGDDECDDGNAVDGDGCTACIVDVCGDGIVNDGDECDDGNAVDGDGCTACIVDVCGDGIVNGDDECDDGNAVDGDGCTACIVDVCGDGIVNDGDECDDGNAVDGDGCTACVTDFCGDGVDNDGVNEACDDGNSVDGDGCSSCVADICGDGVVQDQLGEECDDGNVSSDDGCTSECFVERGFVERHIVTNGEVRATTALDGVVYMGGFFSRVAPYTGGFAGLDVTTAAHDQTWPEVDGTVFKIVADGAGGFFIAGSFKHIGGVARDNLAHIDAARQVLPSPSVNGLVELLIVEAGVVYIKGAFTSVGGQARAGLAAFNGTTNVVTAWQPGITAASVLAMTSRAGIIYVGGAFTQAGLPATTRNRLAAFHGTTGVLQSWNPGANNVVSALGVMVDEIYVGGRFTAIGGGTGTTLRKGLAVVTPTATIGAWNPTFAEETSVISIDGNRLAVAARFGVYLEQRLGPNQYSAPLVVQVGSGIGVVSVTTLLATPSGVAIGGGLSNVNGTTRRHMAVVSWTGALQSWAQHFMGPAVFAIATDGARYLTGGHFSGIGGVARANLVAFDEASGDALPWAPSASDSIVDIAATPTAIYVGGIFSAVGGQTRKGIAALHPVTASVLPFNAPGVEVATRLIVAGNDLYATGTVDSFPGQTMRRVVSLDRTTGARLGTLDVTGSAPVLAADATSLYVGGQFTSLGGVARNNLAAVSRSTFQVSAWNPAPQGVVEDVATAPGVVYVLGSFGFIGGASSFGLSALSPSTGAKLPTWQPTNIQGTSLAIGAEGLYLAQRYLGSSLPGLVLLDGVTGANLQWTSRAPVPVAFGARRPTLTPTRIITAPASTTANLPSLDIGASFLR